MPDADAPTCRLAVIVTRPGSAEILAIGAADGASTVTLPSTMVSSQGPIRDWIAAIDALFGTPTTLLRHETLASVDHDHPTLIVAEVEPVDPPASVGRWWPEAALAAAIEEPLRVSFERRARRRTTTTAARMAPWVVPGWTDRAASWMTDTLEAAGRRPTGPPVQHYLWSLTSILRCPTTAGDAYLKATSGLFGQEAPVTALLATRTPGLTPEVIAIEPAERWLLLADLGGPPIGDRPESDWPSGLATHARIQRAWTDDTDALLAAGAPFRSLASVAAGAEEIRNDDALMTRLDATQRDAYRATVPRLIEACERLEALGIGRGLVHGDLHDWNVAFGPAGPVVFDWSDAAIGHPFIDLVPYVLRSDDVTVRRACVDAYLAAWADVASPDALRAAAELALPVGCLYQVLSYRAITAALGEDETDDMIGADVDWLDRTLRVLDEGIAVAPRT